MENIEKASVVEEKQLSHHIIAYRISEAGFALEPAPPSRSWMNDTHGHAQRCLPLLAANSMGWIIRNPCDATAIWNGGTQKEDSSCMTDDDKYIKSVHSHFGWGVITWQIPWLFRTTGDIGLLVRGCTNFWIDNAIPLDGFVETYWSPYTFTFNWKITKPNVFVHWKKGDPICMIIPYPIGLIEKVTGEYKVLSDNPELEKTYRDWSAYRDDFNNNDKKRADGGGWQKDYFLGKKCPFAHGQENIASPHKTKFTLNDFEERTG